MLRPALYSCAPEGALQQLEAALSKGQYLAGSSLTLADVSERRWCGRNTGQQQPPPVHSIHACTPCSWLPLLCKAQQQS